MDAPDQFTQIGTVQDVASGAHATIQWNGLDPNTEYEWYAVASDGSAVDPGSHVQLHDRGPAGITAGHRLRDDQPADPADERHPHARRAEPRRQQRPDHVPVPVDEERLQHRWRHAATLNLATAGNGDKGDVIRATVTANDGSANSLPVTSAPVTILNTAPTATVGLSPSTPRPTQTATATATRVDADGDAVTLSYVWKLNGATVKTTAASSSLTDTLDLSTTTAANGDVLASRSRRTTARPTARWCPPPPRSTSRSVSAIPDSTFQVNGNRVNALLRVGNTIYIGGDFTQLLGHNGEIVSRQNIAAVNATTGQPLPWDPNADGTVLRARRYHPTALDDLRVVGYVHPRRHS